MALQNHHIIYSETQEGKTLQLHKRSAPTTIFYLFPIILSLARARRQGTGGWREKGHSRRTRLTLGLDDVQAAQEDGEAHLLYWLGLQIDPRRRRTRCKHVGSASWSAARGLACARSVARRLLSRAPAPPLLLAADGTEALKQEGKPLAAAQGKTRGGRGWRGGCLL